MQSLKGQPRNILWITIVLAAALACSLGPAATPTPALPPTEAPPTANPPAAATPNPPAPSEATAAPGGQGGHLTYMLEGERVYRMEAAAGAAPEDVSAALDALSPGTGDGWLNLSPDGAWLVLTTERFDPDCNDWACLAILPADLSTGEAVRAGDEAVHPEGWPAVASGGNLIVYPDAGGPHTLDLWAVQREGESWSEPLLLTNDSPYAYHDVPAISDDGSHVVFDCADQPYGAAGTALCEAGTDGGGFRVVLTPGQGPGGSDVNALHHADYAPDGSLVFEADWNGEQIWRLPAGGGPPAVVNPDFGNDNSPCVLPDGRIASLWLERPGSSGQHELKLMAADGSSYEMALTGIDVQDSGIGCGG
jgi:hypothetical protein